MTLCQLEPGSRRLVLSRLRARLMALMPSMVAADWPSQDYKEGDVLGRTLATGWCQGH